MQKKKELLPSWKLALQLAGFDLGPLPHSQLLGHFKSNDKSSKASRH